MRYKSRIRQEFADLKRIRRVTDFEGYIDTGTTDPSATNNILQTHAVFELRKIKSRKFFVLSPRHFVQKRQLCIKVWILL